MQHVASLGGDKSLCEWGSRALLMRLVAEGKKLFLWCEVLVLMECSLLPEGSDSKCLWPTPPTPVTIFPASLRVPEAHRSWRDESELNDAACPCPRQQQQQQTTRWWRRWGWSDGSVEVEWWQRRSAPSLTLADRTSSAAAGSTSSAVLSWWVSSWWGPGWWWHPESRRTPQCWLKSHTGWWGWVGLRSS